MQVPKDIYEDTSVLNYLKSRNILSQYLKARKYLLAGYIQQIQFSLREPKKQGVRYFRITKKYRAYGVFRKDGVFLVFKISDHQN